MIVNVKITETKLGYEDPGIFTYRLALEGDGLYGYYGNYALDTYNAELKTREATALGFQAIINLINMLEVSSWEDIKGQFIRCEIQGQEIVKIGHLIKNKWLSLKEFFETANAAKSDSAEKIKDTTEDVSLANEASGVAKESLSMPETNIKAATSKNKAKK